MDNLLLISKNDIPFQQARLVIHQPTLKEIGYIGEETFLNACQGLVFLRNGLNEEDKLHLKDLTDFEILMTILRSKSIQSSQMKAYIHMLLILMFPDCTINFLPTGFMVSVTIDDNKENHLIDKDNFESFKNIVSNMFCLNEIFGESADQKYNPSGPQAAALVKKFKEREKKLAKIKNKDRSKGFSVFAHYISVLAVGQHKDMNDLLQYTVYQLVDEYRRFKMKIDFDLYVQFKLAGAKDVQDVENWMSDIHSDIL